MIPFVNLKKEYRQEKSKIDRAIKKVLESGVYLNGPQTQKFEKEFANFLGAKYAIGVGSGTDAIVLAFKALNLKPGDEVIVPANVQPPIFAFKKTGIAPLLSDVNSETLNLNYDALKKVKLSKKTRAILFVHLYGNPEGVLDAKKFAKERGLFLIEDCSHAHGAKAEDRYAGAIGDLGCFSFYPTKNLGAIGDAGMVVTNSMPLSKRIRLIKESGAASNLDEIQASILSVKIKSLKVNNSKRKNLAEYYGSQLGGLPIILQHKTPGFTNAYLNFVIRTPKRNELQNFLLKKGIITKVHYSTSLGKGFPNSDKASKTVLSLPMYPSLTKEEIKIVCNALKEFFKQR